MLNLMLTRTTLRSAPSRLARTARPFSTNSRILLASTDKPKKSKKMSSNTSDQQATMADQAKSAAGIAAGHAQYAQGAATTAIGSATGSSEWQQSGEATKQAGADSIREAVNQAPEGGKVGEMADQACPQTGEGVGSKSSGN